MIAPFPWYGGKRRKAAAVWQRFGDDVEVYVEPFAGSLAVLLYRERAVMREVVCDTDGGICNFWRAIKYDPEQVAHWADYPAIQQDLTARHKWLIAWINDNRDRLCEDPEYYDARAAGWWVWGISLASGGGSNWCCKVYDNRPYTQPTSGGQGVSKQRIKLPYNTLAAWFDTLSKRLECTVVFNKSWESAVTRSVLCQTRRKQYNVAIFMDPPYLSKDRDQLYSSDIIKKSDKAAIDSWQWAQEHGDRYRIAYCAHRGDFDISADWYIEESSYVSIRKAARKARRELIAYSPACFSTEVEAEVEAEVIGSMRRLQDL